mgnify:FL=1
MNEVRLYRIGSDPEFVIGRVQEWTTLVVPASEIISSNRGAALQSFIGTDGHPSTAELRPPPAHNIRRHLMDIAAALDAVDIVLKARQHQYPGLTMFASPVVGGETQGGHIHVSAFVNHPGAIVAERRNLVYTGTDFTTLSDNRGAPGERPLTSSEALALQEYAQLAYQDGLFTSNTFSLAMNYLLVPFERWIQPWFARISRNGSYGGEGQEVRWTAGPRPSMPRFYEWAYYLFEYRTPSTWLTHPWLAYAYLALTKLTILNFEQARELALNRAVIPPLSGREPKNAVWGKEFADRYANTTRFKFTNDIKQLEEAIQICAKERERWFAPNTPIHIDAWRKLL